VRACGLAGLLVGALVLAGCGGSEEAKAPTSFTANDGSVSKIITEAINGGTSPGLAKPPEVHCFNKECLISYVIKEPTGVSYELEEILPTRQVWKALFEDPSIKAAKITVEGPVESLGGKKETGEIYELECNREDASQIDWDNVDEEGMTKICKYERKVK
jgi:hypothetical protein